MLQRVLLLDELGEKFGEVHEYYNLRTPNDAIKLLGINNPEFLKELMTSGERGIGYRVMQGGEDFELEDMLLPFGKNDLAIVPVVMGSSIWRVLTGAAMVGLAFATGGASLSFNSLALASPAVTGVAFSGLVAQTAVYVGASLALGGVAQMLSPQPELPMEVINPTGSFGGGSLGGIERGSNGQQSYFYRGAINSVGAGATVPVVFGTALIGSHVLSADIDVADDSDRTNTWITTPDPNTVRVNGINLQSDPKEFKGDTNGFKVRRITAKGDDKNYSWYNNNDHSDEISWKLNNPVAIDLSNSTLTTIPLDRGASFLKGESSGFQDTRKFQIGFRLKNGLFQYIAGEGSTKIHGDIQLNIRIRNTSASTDVGNFRVNLQGLLRPTQDYAFACWVPFSKIAHKDRHEVSYEVVDHNLVVPSGKNLSSMIEVVQIGYLWAGWQGFGTGYLTQIDWLPDRKSPNVPAG